MNYYTIYEIAPDPFAGLWQMLSVQPEFWLLFLLMTLPALVMLVLSFTPYGENHFRARNDMAVRFPSSGQRFVANSLSGKILGTAIIIICFVVFPMGGFASQYCANRSLQSEYKNGKLTILEGVVSDFTYGQGYKGPTTIRFKINNQNIAYSDSSPGFALAKRDLLHNGERVRIWAQSYVDKPRSLTRKYPWHSDDSVAIARFDVEKPQLSASNPISGDAKPHGPKKQIGNRELKSSRDIHSTHTTISTRPSPHIVSRNRK